MTETGIIRRVDELGRIVLPKEIRREMRIREGTPMEIYLDGDTIILRRYRAMVHAKDALVDTRILVEEHSQDMDPAVAAEVADLLEKAEKLLIENET